MSEYGMQLKNIGIDLQNIGMKINNIGMQMPFTMNYFGFQIKNIGQNIINFALQIFNIGESISSNINNNFQMNNNLFGDISKMDSINKNINQKDNNYITIKFWNRMNDEKINITTTYEKTVEELLNLYIQRKCLSSNYLKNNFFIFNSLKIKPNEKKTLLNYGLKHLDIIQIVESNNFIDGP